MSPDELKRAAAAAAVALVEPGMVVGLGTGSTAAWGIRLLAERHLAITAVATSVESAELARELGISVTDLSDVPGVDLTFDGADEADPDGNLIKGLGAALLREKLVALQSRREVIIVDASKLVQRLGEKAPLPVEVIPFGWRHTASALRELGLEPALRRRGGDPVVTNNGNWVLDCRVSPGALDAGLGAAIKALSGVVDHGLFWQIATDVIVAWPDGRVEHRRYPRS